MPLHFLTRPLEKHLVAVILAATLAAGCAATAEPPAKVVILHTNDLHGQISPRNGVGGMAEIATIVDDIDPDLILDAGDMFTGTVINDEFQGLPIIQAMNRIGYHAAAMGNHEFDYGMDVLALRAQDAKFRIVTANVDTRIPEIPKYTVVKAKGVDFGIIGLTTEEVRVTTHPKNLGNVTVADIVTSVRSILPEVKSKSDVVIILSHITEEEEERLAAAFPEILLIISGHEHSRIGSFVAGRTTIAKTGSSGRNVGRIDLEVQNREITRIDATLIPVNDVKPHEDVVRIIKPYEEKVAAKMSLVLGEAMGDLNRSSEGESAISNLVADAFRQKTKTQIVVHNLGGIRANIPNGPITWGRAFEVLPFQNTLVTLEMTGSQLKQLLSRALLAVSGIRIHMDLSKPAGQKLISAQLSDGTPIADTRTYTVTTNDFAMAGGDGLIEFSQGKNVKDTAMFLRDVLADYIKTRGKITPMFDGRVRVN